MVICIEFYKHAIILYIVRLIMDWTDYIPNG